MELVQISLKNLNTGRLAINTKILAFCCCYFINLPYRIRRLNTDPDPGGKEWGSESKALLQKPIYCIYK